MTYRSAALHFALTLCLLALPAWSGARAQPALDELYRALGLPELIEIMRVEGIVYGAELRQDMFPGRGEARWSGMVEEIYAPGRMDGDMRAFMAAELGEADLGPMTAFFLSDQGRRIIELEIAARRALLDDAVEEASRDQLAGMIRDRAPRLDSLRAFAEVNDLVDFNVVGALNANYAFYVGLSEGGAFPDALSDEEILADVWSQEPGIRDETEEWLFSYLALAYQPLEDADLDAYIAFSETEAGQILNRALFAAFDDMFVAISLDLGRGAAQFLAGEEL